MTEAQGAVREFPKPRNAQNTRKIKLEEIKTAGMSTRRKEHQNPSSRLSEFLFSNGILFRDFRDFRG